MDVEEYNFGCGYKPAFETYLAQYKGLPDLRFLEVGSLAGESASWFLFNILTHPTSNLTCLDPWETSKAKEKEEQFNIAVMPYATKVIKVKKDSFYWLIENQTTQYDFIYIDGDHRCAGATLDLFASFPLLKVGGVMAIDDYNLKTWRDLPGVQPAVNLFLDLMSDKIKVLNKDNQVWLQKLTS
jgi:predicted O-methyltransferase YrrM